jgi:4'-phosphopantetheinyl transferase
MSRIYLGGIECARAAVGTVAKPVLSKEERDRARALRSPSAIRRFAAGRWLVRTMLSDLLGMPAASVPIAITTNGRPFLGCAGPWHFSLSHSGDIAACAVADIPVGLDLEQVILDRDLLTIARESFQPAEADMVAASLATEGRKVAATRFYAYWTLKEAYLKLREGSVWDMRNAPAFLLGGPPAPAVQSPGWWCMEIPPQGAFSRPYVLSLGTGELTDAGGRLTVPELHRRHLFADERRLRPLLLFAYDA